MCKPSKPALLPAPRQRRQHQQSFAATCYASGRARAFPFRPHQTLFQCPARPYWPARKITALRCCSEGKLHNRSQFLGWRNWVWYRFVLGGQLAWRGTNQRSIARRIISAKKGAYGGKEGIYRVSRCGMKADFPVHAQSLISIEGCSRDQAFGTVFILYVCCWLACSASFWL